MRMTIVDMLKVKRREAEDDGEDEEASGGGWPLYICCRLREERLRMMERMKRPADEADYCTSVAG